jgi:cytosine/adenosine deaminase-related metal-dependent hydrolase
MTTSTPDAGTAMLDLAIVNGTVITMDAQRRVLIGGGVGIRDGRITQVEADAGALEAAREVIDAAGSIVLPGIVDTHGHAGHCLTRGFGEGLDEGGWMEIVETLYFHASDEWFWTAESRLAALERLRFGVTTSVSMTGSSPRVDDARYAVAASTGYQELGLRHIVAAGPPYGPWPRTYTEQLPGGTSGGITVDLDRALAVTEEAIQAFRHLGNERIRFYVGPSVICPTGDPDDAESRSQVNGVKRLVEQYGTGLHTHAFAGQIAAAHAIDPEILGPHACIAHCAGISMEEIGILAKTGASASSGPLTHAYINARFPVIEALDAGVNVVFSTDGSAPDRSFDLIDQARIGMQLQRVHFNDDRILPVGKTLGMITIDAARALGMDQEVGSLETGKRADVILIDARQAHLAPEILAPLRVIGHASGQDVTTVIVDGQVLMRDRVVSGIDEAAILDDARDALLAAWERAGFGDINAQHPYTWHGVRYGA